MSGMPRVDTAIGAISAVEMADQLMRGIRDDRQHQSTEAQAHYVKAAVAGAIAIGAYEMLKKDERRENGNHSHSHHDRVGTDGATSEHRSKSQYDEHHSNGHDHHGHHSNFIAEALGAYSLGRQAMGHSEHNILKLVAEGLGAVALGKEVHTEMGK